MNFKERFVSTMAFQAVDQVPCMDFGYWPETIARWHEEGLPREVRTTSQVEDYLGLDRGYLCSYKSFDLDGPMPEHLYVAANFFDYRGDIWPPFEEAVLEEDEEHVVKRSPVGIVYRQNKGLQSMPQFLSFPVRDLDDWNALKKRLDSRIPERYPPDWEQKVADYQRRQQPLGLSIMGFFGAAREFMGLEALCFAYYEQPDLVTAMAEHQAQFTIEAYDRATRDLQIDFVISFEDMCYNSGPLISPKLFRKFMSPYYERVTAFFKSRGVRCFLVDSDGNMLQTLGLFLEAGVDGCIPCEIKAGSDPLLLRQMYPGVRLMGGIDKLALIQGRQAVDHELERVIPLLEAGGYIPSPDHVVPPTVSFDQYRYFVERRAELVRRYHP